MRFFDSKLYLKQIWKNGGGSTREIFKVPFDSADYAIRFSLADVKESGPFSAFSGSRSVNFAPRPCALFALFLYPDVINSIEANAVIEREL